jgi:beta-glucanase (GH16 family)
MSNLAPFAHIGGLPSVLLVATLAACTPARPGWELVWEDEFDGPEGQAPDAAKWTYDLGGWGWGNGELQHYTDRPENVALDGRGRLSITALQEDFDGNAYTSARIKTQGIFEHGFGRFEARLRMPAGRGLWPAFWLLGANFEEVGWPICGELDVMEMRGSTPSRVQAAMHGPGYSGGGSFGGAIQLDEGSFADDFHDFAVEYDPDRIWWYVDDELYFSVSQSDLPESAPWVFDHEFFILLNLAVGGGYVLPPNADTPFPAEMKVDWVRVYRPIP